MAQVELEDWPTDKWDDGSDASKLQVSEPFFQNSLAATATNRTANHRLGLIAMLWKNFDGAVTHLEAARQVDDSHPGIRKALAYSYVWSGNSAEAQDLLIHIPEAEQEIPAEMLDNFRKIPLMFSSFSALSRSFRIWFSPTMSDP